MCNDILTDTSCAGPSDILRPAVTCVQALGICCPPHRSRVITDQPEQGPEIYVGCSNGELLRYVLQGHDAVSVRDIPLALGCSLVFSVLLSQDPTVCYRVKVFQIASLSMNSYWYLVSSVFSFSRVRTRSCRPFIVSLTGCC